VGVALSDDEQADSASAQLTGTKNFIADQPTVRGR
jgi:hypothetical protein